MAMPPPKYQDLSLFRLPDGFRGRSGFFVQLWWLVRALFFHTSPQFMYGWRRFLLRLFGAKIGKCVVIRPSVRVTYPWKLSIGDHSWIGDHVDLYNLAPITIGESTAISQGSYLCTGGHDYDRIDFAIYGRSITIDDQVWVAAQVFVGPGMRIGRGAIVCARSLVLKDVPPGMIVAGQPAAVKGARKPPLEGQP